MKAVFGLGFLSAGSMSKSGAVPKGLQAVIRIVKAFLGRTDFLNCFRLLPCGF